MTNTATATDSRNNVAHQFEVRLDALRALAEGLQDVILEAELDSAASSLNWGDVGTLGYLVDKMAEVLDAAGQTTTVEAALSKLSL